MKHIYKTFCGALSCAALASGLAFTAFANAPMRAPGLGKARVAKKVQKLGDSKYDNTDGHDLREVKTEGSLRVLAIIVEFPDVKFTSSEDPRQIIDDMLNQPGFSQQGACGSARDFYLTTSFGQFTPQFDVFGPVMMDKPEVDYVQSDEKYTDPETGKEVSVYPAGRMIEEAIRKIDDKVDFSQYDSNGDGVVDFVYVFYAGKGATTGGDRNTTIWPHAFTLTSAIGGPVELDGVKIDRYATSSEKGSNNRLSGIGTFCHEFGHVLGLPDLYDTGNNGTVSKCFTPGEFDCMDAGNYNNSEHSPALFSAYERYAMEWLLPTTITDGGHFTLLPTEAHNFAYKIPTVSDPQEYFLLENRGTGYYDRYLPNSGLLVWHIDYDRKLWEDNRPNNDPAHQRIDIVEADNSQENSSRAGDVYPGSYGICEFQSSVTPAFVDWNNKPTGFELEQIQRHPDGAVSFVATTMRDVLMDGTDMAMPMPRVTGTSSSSVSIEWDSVKGANEYRLTLYDPRTFDGVLAKDFAPGYWFADITDGITEADGLCSYDIEGLEPGHRYTAVLYALNGVTARRAAYELPLSAQAAEFAQAAPTVRAFSEASGNVLLQWDAVEGAERYVAEVGRLLPGKTVGEMTVGFDNSRLPEGWEGIGTYDKRANYCGVSAPSYSLSASGSWLKTSRCDSDIASITFWGRQRFSDARGILDFYSMTEDGSMTHVARLEGFTNKGADYTVNFPAGVRRLCMVFTPVATDLTLFIDDMRLTLAAEGRATEVRKIGTSELFASFSSLRADTEYSARVWGFRGDESSALSEWLTFTPVTLNPPSAIEAVGTDSEISFTVSGGMIIPADADAVYDLYSADGRCVARGARGAMPLPARGLYIAVAGKSSVKMVW